MMPTLLHWQRLNQVKSWLTVVQLWRLSMCFQQLISFTTCACGLRSALQPGLTALSQSGAKWIRFIDNVMTTTSNSLQALCFTMKTLRSEHVMVVGRELEAAVA